MVDECVEPMPQQLPNWGFMQCIMQHVYIEPGMLGLVFHTLITLGWTDREGYPSPLDLLTRLNDVASIDLVHSLLKDAIFIVILQAWVITDHLSGAHTYSSHLNEAIRTLIKYRIQAAT